MNLLNQAIMESILPSLNRWEKSASGYNYKVPDKDIKASIKVSKNKENVTVYDASVTGLPKGNATRRLRTLPSAHAFCVKAIQRAHLSEIAMPVTPIDNMIPPISEWHKYKTKTGKSWSYTVPDASTGYLINEISPTSYEAFAFDHGISGRRKLIGFVSLGEAFQECEIDWQTKKREMAVTEAEEFPEFLPIKRWQHSTNLYTLNIAGLRYEITFDKHSENKEIWGAYVEPRSHGTITSRLGNYFDFDSAYARCKLDYEKRMKESTNESMNYKLYNPIAEKISKTTFKTIAKAYTVKGSVDAPLEVVTLEGQRVDARGAPRGGKIHINMVTEAKYQSYWAVEGRYEGHWEEVSAAVSWKEAKGYLKDYRENEPGVEFRARLRREKIEESTVQSDAVAKPINSNRHLQLALDVQNQLKEETTIVTPNDAVYHSPNSRIPGKQVNVGSGDFSSNFIKNREMQDELGHEDVEDAESKSLQREREKTERWKLYTDKIKQDNIDRLHTFDWSGISESSRKKLINKYGIRSIIDWPRFEKDLNRMKLHYPVYLNSYEPDYVNEAEEVHYIHYADWVKAVREKYNLTEAQFKSMTHILGDWADNKLSTTGKHLEVRNSDGKVLARWFNHRGSI